MIRYQNNKKWSARAVMERFHQLQVAQREASKNQKELTLSNALAPEGLLAADVLGHKPFRATLTTDFDESDTGCVLREVAFVGKRCVGLTQPTETRGRELLRRPVCLRTTKQRCMAVKTPTCS